MTKNEAISILIPEEIKCHVTDHLACFRFHYLPPDGEVIPQADKLYTALTPEQAMDVIIFLESYINKMAATGASKTGKPRH